MIYLGIYAAAVVGFLFVWSRALPPAENNSRAVARYLRERAPDCQPNSDWPSVSFDFSGPLHAVPNATATADRTTAKATDLSGSTQ
jgi:hypothetical protein